MQGKLEHNRQPTSEVRFLDKSRQVSFCPITPVNLPWFPHQFIYNDFGPARGESKQECRTLSKHSSSKKVDGEGSCTTTRPPILEHSGSLSGTAVLPKPTTGQGDCPTQRKLVRVRVDTLPGLSSGIVNLNKLHQSVERSNPSQPNSRSDNSDRRITPGLGCLPREAAV